MTRIFVSLFFIVASSGCASITRGTSEAYVIETTPPGADVTLSTGLTCTTPCSLKVKRRGDFVVTIEKDGYQTVRSSITSSVDGGGAAGMAGNVLIGGLIGAGIDAGTGAMHSHKPNPLSVTLVPGDGEYEIAVAAETGADTGSADSEAAAELEAGETEYVPETAKSDTPEPDWPGLRKAEKR